MIHPSKMRYILHLDINYFYAQALLFLRPELRDKPVVVGGSVEERHGIVLTKNMVAKRYGIQTGEVIWSAMKKCPGLISLAPDYKLFEYLSEAFRRMLYQYTDQVESFGLDESWIDITCPGMTMAIATQIANVIRRRTVEELGLTISVGVSFNKIFAKLGSDMKKPDATTVITPENYQEKVWPLAVSELLYVGPATTQKLASYGVFNIGQLALAPEVMLKGALGKNGLLLKVFAMGADPSPVVRNDAIKSVGNSTTAPHDVATQDDAHAIIYNLSESVARRLREQGYRGNCITVSARTTELVSTSHQRKIITPTSLTGEIGKVAIRLFDERYLARDVYRSIGVNVSGLVPNASPQQLDLLEDNARREKLLDLEYILDDLRDRFGSKSVVRAITMADKELARVNPYDNHLRPAAAFSR